MITAAKINAIDTFIRAEKSAGRYTSLKRFYLPIWSNASGNAICLVSRTSGTFVGGVTHGAGFVQGNGTTGYFNSGVTTDAMGLSRTSNCAGVLVAQAATADSHFIASQSGLQSIDIVCYSPIARAGNYGSVGDITTSRANQVGIIATSRTSDTAHKVAQRRQSSYNLVTGSDSTAGTGAITNNAVFMSRNHTGTPSSFSNARFGAAWFALGLNDSDLENYTLNLKTLWETCTGNVLP
jgi:hypothetical protein